MDKYSYCPKIGGCPAMAVLNTKRSIEKGSRAVPEGFYGGRRAFLDGLDDLAKDPIFIANTLMDQE